MDQRIVVFLEAPLSAFNSNEYTPRQVVLAGLKWPTEYWPNLALSWLEQGVEIDQDISTILEQLAKNNNFSQSLRHKALALSRRWQKNKGPLNVPAT